MEACFQQVAGPACAQRRMHMPHAGCDRMRAGSIACTRTCHDPPNALQGSLLIVHFTSSRR